MGERGHGMQSGSSLADLLHQLSSMEGALRGEFSAARQDINHLQQPLGSSGNRQGSRRLDQSTANGASASNSGGNAYKQGSESKPNGLYHESETLVRKPVTNDLTLPPNRTTLQTAEAPLVTSELGAKTMQQLLSLSRVAAGPAVTGKEAPTCPPVMPALLPISTIKPALLPQQAISVSRADNGGTMGVSLCAPALPSQPPGIPQLLMSGARSSAQCAVVPAGHDINTLRHQLSQVRHVLTLSGSRKLL